jgi:hypothetical protein
LDKHGQKEIVLKIVRTRQPIRTEQVKIFSMNAGVSCADRYLRWLRRDGMIIGCKEHGNRTKTWRTCSPEVSPNPQTEQYLLTDVQGASLCREPMLQAN